MEQKVSFIVKRRNPALEISLETFFSDLLDIMDIFGRPYKIGIKYGKEGKNKTALEVYVDAHDAFSFYNMVNFMKSKYLIQPTERIVF